jgi:hypothetical protein
MTNTEKRLRARVAELERELQTTVARTNDALRQGVYPEREDLTVICTTCGRELDIVTFLGDSGHTTLGVRLDHFHG